MARTSKGCADSDGRRTRRLDSLAHRSRTAPAPCAARTDHSRVCRWAGQHDRRKWLRMSQTTCANGAPVRARRTGRPLDAAAPGHARQISDEQIEQVIVRTLEETPRARRTGAPRPGESDRVGRTTIQEIWRRSAAAASHRDIQAVDRSVC